MTQQNLQTDRSEKILQQLRAHGYKITPARRAIVESLQDDHEHFEPNTILERSRKAHAAIGRATVYRTLETLTQLGVLRPIHCNQNTLAFIWADGGHHHMVCADCGTVVEFDDCIAGTMTSKLEREYGFKVSSHLLEFYGQCGECQK